MFYCTNLWLGVGVLKVHFTSMSDSFAPQTKTLCRYDRRLDFLLHVSEYRCKTWGLCDTYSKLGGFSRIWGELSNAPNKTSKSGLEGRKHPDESPPQPQIFNHTVPECLRVVSFSSLGDRWPHLLPRLHICPGLQSPMLPFCLLQSSPVMCTNCFSDVSFQATACGWQ